MQGLNFRKKRKHIQKGSYGRKRRPGGLRFEEKKAGPHFADEHPRRRKIEPGAVVVWAVEILIVCMAAVLLVAAFGQRVSTAGDSMAPELRNGDVVLVNRLIYKVKGPSRGDIVVFRQEEDSHYSIKRVVGLPGETVQIVEGSLLINGEEPEGDLQVSEIEYAGLAEEPVELGADEYFVIGDNHEASDDSRDPDIGNIKREDIYGTPWLIVSPWGHFGRIG